MNPVDNFRHNPTLMVPKDTSGCLWNYKENKNCLTCHILIKRWWFMVKKKETVIAFYFAILNSKSSRTGKKTTTIFWLLFNLYFHSIWIIFLISKRHIVEKRDIKVKLSTNTDLYSDPNSISFMSQQSWCNTVRVNLGSSWAKEMVH